MAHCSFKDPPKLDSVMAGNMKKKGRRPCRFFCYNNPMIKEVPNQ
jgi:hypothetical protein